MLTKPMMPAQPKNTRRPTPREPKPGRVMSWVGVGFALVLLGVFAVFGFVLAEAALSHELTAPDILVAFLRMWELARGVLPWTDGGAGASGPCTPPL
jgi:hypothetical protein